MTKMMPDLEGYFRGLAPDTDALLRELEAEAARESIPIVGPVVGELLFVLTRATGAKTILELGTATGYSGIFLGRACAQIPGRVISLELDDAMANRARGNLARAGLTEVVEVRVGEALKLMAEMSETFDLIFLDIDKESYLPALSLLPAPPALGRPPGGGQRRLFRGGGFQPRTCGQPRLARRPPAELSAPPLPGTRRPGPGGEGRAVRAALVGAHLGVRPACGAAQAALGPAPTARR